VGGRRVFFFETRAFERAKVPPLCLQFEVDVSRCHQVQVDHN
jgi:hypothetical protein